MNSTERRKYRGTIQKILSIEQLPSHEEVVDLVYFTESRFRDKRKREEFKDLIAGLPHVPEEHGVRHLMSYSGEAPQFVEFEDCAFFMEPLTGAFWKLDVHQILTEEFVYALSHRIKTIKPEEPYVEVAAGNGKLSSCLRKYDIPIQATDRNPPNDAKNVRKMDHKTVLESYKPGFVLACWIPPKTDAGIRRDVLEYPTVSAYIEIVSMLQDFAAPSGFRELALKDIQEYGIPADLFHKSSNVETGVERKTLEKFRKNQKDFLRTNGQKICMVRK